METIGDLLSKEISSVTNRQNLYPGAYRNYLWGRKSPVALQSMALSLGSLEPLAPDLSLSDRIAWFREDYACEELGTVRWIGRLPSLSPGWSVGVEFDRPIGTGNGRLGSRQLFVSKTNHAYFLPISCLRKKTLSHCAVGVGKSCNATQVDLPFLDAHCSSVRQLQVSDSHSGSNNICKCCQQERRSRESWQDSRHSLVSCPAVVSPVQLEFVSVTSSSSDGDDNSKFHTLVACFLPRYRKSKKHKKKLQNFVLTPEKATVSYVRSCGSSRQVEKPYRLFNATQQRKKKRRAPSPPRVGLSTYPLNNTLGSQRNAAKNSIGDDCSITTTHNDIFDKTTRIISPHPRKSVKRRAPLPPMSISNESAHQQYRQSFTPPVLPKKTIISRSYFGFDAKLKEPGGRASTDEYTHKKETQKEQSEDKPGGIDNSTAKDGQFCGKPPRKEDSMTTESVKKTTNVKLTSEHRDTTSNSRFQDSEKDEFGSLENILAELEQTVKSKPSVQQFLAIFTKFTERAENIKDPPREKRLTRSTVKAEVESVLTKSLKSFPTKWKFNAHKAENDLSKRNGPSDGLSLYSPNITQDKDKAETLEEEIDAHSDRILVDSHQVLKEKHDTAPRPLAHHILTRDGKRMNSLPSKLECIAGKPPLPSACKATKDPLGRQAKVAALFLQLDSAIAKGLHNRAAVLARELATYKVSPSVRTFKAQDKSPDPSEKIVTVSLYVEDKNSHQGPIPMPVYPSMTVKMLKDKVQREYQFSVDCQRWILGKTFVVHDALTLAELDVCTPGCPIFLYIVSPDRHVEAAAEKSPVSSEPKPGEHPPHLATVEEICEDNSSSHSSSITQDEVHDDPKKNYQDLVQLEDQDLVSNSESFECSVCFLEVDQGHGVVLRDCLHSFCKECLAQAVEYGEEATIKCPFRNDEYSCGSHLQDREIKALVDTPLYEKHLQRSMAFAESQASNSFHCKSPDCPGWCLYEDNVNVFPCPVCGHQNCLTCRAIHEDQDCKQYQDQLDFQSAANEDARKTRDYLDNMVTEGQAMHCPTCKVILMKKWGCDWLKCSVCQTEICWVTKGPRWGPLGRGDTSGGCKCGVKGVRCHPKCNYCH